MAIMILTLFGFAFALGLIARRLMPGPNPAGIIGTILIGIAGGLIFGLIGSLVAGLPLQAFDGRTLLLAISGTMYALFGYRTFALRWPNELESKQHTPERVRDVLTHTFLSTWK